MAATKALWVNNRMEWNGGRARPILLRRLQLRGGADTGEEQMTPDASLSSCLHGVADHFHDPGTVRPLRLDVLLCLLPLRGSHRLGHVAP